MLRFALRSLTICFVVQAVVGLNVYGQEEPLVRNLFSEQLPDVLPPGLRPDAIFMRNQDGESVLIPRGSYEDFERYLAERRSDAAVFANTTLVSFSAQITIDKKIARIQSELDAKSDSASSKWRSLPIGLSLVQLLPDVSSNSDPNGLSPIRVSNNSLGYEWRIAPGQELDHRLAFQSVANVSSGRAQDSLRLDLPVATCTLTFRLPKGEWELSATGRGSEVVEVFRDAQEWSEAIVRTSGGPVTLTWQKKPSTNNLQAIEVESNTKYQPTSEPNRFRTTSTLAIRGPKALGGRRFLVHLPPGALWREPNIPSTSYQGYRINRTDSIAENAPVSLELEFEEAVSRSDADLILEWSQVMDDRTHSASFAIPNIEGVQRHTGSLEIVLPKSVQVRWRPQESIQFQKQATDASENHAYFFRINDSSRPVELAWNVADRASRLRATYRITLEPNRLLLFGTYELAEEIRTLPFLQLETQGWSVERVQVTPTGRNIDLASNRSTTPSSQPQPQAEGSTSISLPLSELMESFPLSNAGNREDSKSGPQRGVSFVLSQKRPDLTSLAQGREMSFVLPMLSWIDSETQQRKSMTLAGDMSLQSSIASLHPTQGSSNNIVEVSYGQRRESDEPALQSELAYRVQTSESWSQWKGSCTVIPSVLKVRTEAKVNLRDSNRWIQQSWHVQHEGLLPSSLLFGIGTDWLSSEASAKEDLDAQVNRIPVALSEVTLSEESGLNTRKFRWFKFSLSSDLQAMEELEITLESAPTSIAIPGGDTEIDWSLPILRPESKRDSLEVEQATVEWKGTSSLQFISALGISGATRDEKLDLTHSDWCLQGKLFSVTKDEVSRVVGESAWMQSVRNAVEQRDRYVIRFRTSADTISVRIPLDRAADARAILNGQRVSLSIDPSVAGQFEIPINGSQMNSQDNKERTHVLEVFTWPPTKPGWLTRLKPEPIFIDRCKRDFPFIWQIIVPSTSNLIASSSNLNSGYRWNWRDLWFGQRSEWTQERLESDLGCSKQPVVGAQTNQYVFFSLSQSESLQIWLAPKYLLWLPIATLFLLTIYAMLEWRWIRSPLLLSLPLVICLLLSTWYWDFSVAAAQCVLSAVLLSIVFAVLKWVVDRKTRRRTVFATRSRTASSIPAQPPVTGTSGSVVSASLPLPTAGPTQSVQAVSGDSQTTTPPADGVVLQ